MCQVKYKIEFNDFENNTFNMIETVRKTKLMSVYHCLIKHSTDNILTISASRLLKRYKNSHIKEWTKYKISLAYFKQLINDLKELGLIIINKTQKTNSYFIPRVANKVAEKVADSEAVESIDIPNFEEDVQMDNIGALSNTYTNTLLPNYGEKVAPVELINYAKKLMKEMRIRSNWVKEEVTKKLSNCTNINSKGMMNYVLKVIIEKKTKQEARREEYRQKVRVGVSSQGSFCNYDQRKYTTQQFAEMEMKLLGWDF